MAEQHEAKELALILGSTKAGDGEKGPQIVCLMETIARRRRSA
jgi:hypothetical protein